MMSAFKISNRRRVADRARRHAETSNQAWGESEVIWIRIVGEFFRRVPLLFQVAGERVKESHEKALRERWRLSPRQAKVASELAAGKTYKEIARDLGITFHTVNTHVKAILEKTGAKTSRRLAAMIHELDNRAP
jgi:DNA-binding CsgD family transcriptional regulator